MKLKPLSCALLALAGLAALTDHGLSSAQEQEDPQVCKASPATEIMKCVLQTANVVLYCKYIMEAGKQFPTEVGTRVWNLRRRKDHNTAVWGRLVHKA